jgi:diadenosine tetraphosphate (Ap4A) HIT family hydrolase
VVEHCVGPLVVGPLIVKPERHVLHVADLTDGDAATMGTVLHRAASVVTELSKPDQVYVSLWWHPGRRPGHIHYVVQPVDQQAMTRHDAHGPNLQAAMFEFDDPPDPERIEKCASQAREAWHR